MGIQKTTASFCKDRSVTADAWCTAQYAHGDMGFVVWCHDCRAPVIKTCVFRSFFVGGLHPEVSREELQEYLSGFVTVDDIDIKMDAATGTMIFGVCSLGI